MPFSDWFCYSVIVVEMTSAWCFWSVHKSDLPVDKVLKCLVDLCNTWLWLHPHQLSLARNLKLTILLETGVDILDNEKWCGDTSQSECFHSFFKFSQITCFLFLLENFMAKITSSEIFFNTRREILFGHIIYSLFFS